MSATDAWAIIYSAEGRRSKVALNISPAERQAQRRELRRRGIPISLSGVDGTKK